MYIEVIGECDDANLDNEDDCPNDVSFQSAEMESLRAVRV